MTNNDLSKLFPNASKHFLQLNRPASVPPVSQASGPLVEHSVGHGPLEAPQAEAGDSAIFLVRITSYRRRLLDEDNLCAKWFCDCCRYAGLIPDDSPDVAHIEIRQIKVKTKAEERTLIEIFEFPTGNA